MFSTMLPCRCGRRSRLRSSLANSYRLPDGKTSTGIYGADAMFLAGFLVRTTNARSLRSELLLKPELVFMDEPTSGLDPEQRFAGWLTVTSEYSN